MVSSFLHEMLFAAKQAPRVYFAPLRGMIDGLRAEWNRMNREALDRDIAKSTPFIRTRMQD